MTTDPVPEARFGTYLGLALITLSTLLYETLLTRIFSVTTYYHYAFVAVSMAMFGLTAGSLIIYLAPSWFPLRSTHRHLALSAATFGVTMVAGFVAHLCVPLTEQQSLVGTTSLALAFASVGTPFVPGGICVALALSRFPARTSSLYAVDLIGAAIGCLTLMALLGPLDAPTVVLAAAAAAGLGACFFALGPDPDDRKLMKPLVAVTLGLIALAAGNAISAGSGFPWIPILYVKGNRAPDYLFDHWSVHSRITVMEAPTDNPYGLGVHPRRRPRNRIPSLRLEIDAQAATQITAFDGGLAPHQYLRSDVVNLAHHLRQKARVAVVGIGGGRDVLTSLVFGQAHTTGLELDAAVLNAVHGVFGRFSGNLARHPAVSLVNAEARSWLASHSETFDIIQISLIDTWAATAAGAFALSENGLYTVQAWRTMFDRLSPTGVLAVSRLWIHPHPGEMYRLANLASHALQAGGVTRPRDHLIIARCLPYPGEEWGIGTLLVSPSPLSRIDIDRAASMCAQNHLELVLAPDRSIDPFLEKLLDPAQEASAIAASPVALHPPTDDQPFFFNMLRLGNVLDPEAGTAARGGFNSRAVVVIVQVLMVSLCMAALCILVPLRLTQDRLRKTTVAPFTLYFGAIGLGFMLVEISMTQRLSIFLGHPTYALATVLTTLLLSCGLGSAASARLAGHSRRIGRERLCVAAVAVGVGLVGIAIGPILDHFRGHADAVRATVAAACLTPLGLCLGMGFPLGMRAVHRQAHDLAPLVWGVNGAMSIVGSTLSVVVSLMAGIGWSHALGTVTYVAALAAHLWMTSLETPPGEELAVDRPPAGC